MIIGWLRRICLLSKVWPSSFEEATKENDDDDGADYDSCELIAIEGLAEKHDDDVIAANAVSKINIIRG